MIDNQEEYIQQGPFRIRKSDLEKRKAGADVQPPPSKPAADIEKTAKAAELETDRMRQLHEKVAAAPDSDAVFGIPVRALLLHTQNLGNPTANSIEKLFLDPEYGPLEMYKSLDQADSKGTKNIFLNLLYVPNKS